MLEPVVHILILTTLTLLMTRHRRRFWPPLILLAYLSLIVLTPVPDWMMAQLERQYSPVLQPTPKDAAIVLTGGTLNYFPSENQYAISGASERFMEAVRLYRRGIVKKLVFTGGSPLKDRDFEVEAVSMARMAEELGLPASDLIVEPEALNTYENAVLTARIPEVQALSDVYLVTSAFHMPRSMRIFRKAGFQVEAYPVDFTRPDDGPTFLWREGGLRHLLLFRLALRESVGLIAYRIIGYAE